MGQVISTAEVSSESECEVMALDRGSEAVEDILQDVDFLMVRNVDFLVTHVRTKALFNLTTCRCSLLQIFAAQQRIARP